MRTIERSSAFKRDYKRAKATPRHRKDVDSLVSTVVALLLSDQVLPENNRDHALICDRDGYRECHIKPESPTPTPYVWHGLAHTARYSAEPAEKRRGHSLFSSVGPRSAPPARRPARRPVLLGCRPRMSEPICETVQSAKRLPARRRAGC